MVAALAGRTSLQAAAAAAAATSGSSGPGLGARRRRRPGRGRELAGGARAWGPQRAARALAAVTRPAEAPSPQSRCPRRRCMPRPRALSERAEGAAQMRRRNLDSGCARGWETVGSGDPRAAENGAR